MDDPWGSPWAADDTQLKLDLPALPPQVHTPQTPHKLASPWAPDDEENAWGGWNAADGGAGTDSPGWGRSPGLRPARSGTLSRHVSPEPWGRLEMLDARSDVADEGKREKDVPITVDSATSNGEEPFPTEVQDEKQEIQVRGLLPERLDNIEKAPEPEASSGSENGSLDSEHEPFDRTESPTGEPRRATAAPDRPEAVRHPSKVQELVHMYDGIAKRKNSPAEPLVAGPRIVLVGSDGAIEQDNETQPGQGRDTSQRSVTDSPSRQDGSLAGESSENASASASLPEELEEPEEPAQSELPASSTEPGPSCSAGAKLPSIPYAYDLKYMDELFPSTPTPPIDPEPVPDVIIDDTFASISERKAWYRISRFGPMRQHNQGNDDDYVRLDWRSSEVRSRTLQIVRRWMEEDSIAGRVVLGRRTGAIGASMFNWDSQAPQVEIGELLGKKSHRRSISGASKGSNGSLPSPSSAAFAWSAGGDGTASVGKPSFDEQKRHSWIAPSLTAESSIPSSFSWNSEPHRPAKVEGSPQAIAPRKAPSPIPTPHVRAPQSLDAIVSDGPAPNFLRIQPIQEVNDDDDDEWGEMVSSPTWPPATSAPNTDALAKITSDTPGHVKSHPTPDLSAVIGPTSELFEMSSGFQTSLPESTQMSLDPWNEADRSHIPSATGQAVSGSRSEPELHAAADVPPSRDTDNLKTIPNPFMATSQVPTLTGVDQPLTADEQAFVARTLNDLPDLSYMLR